MKKIAYVFPGQGSQYVGMAQDFYNNYSCAKDIFQRANKILKYDIAKLCFEGPIEKLSATEYCQPAILTASIACLAVLDELIKRESVSSVAGHSLGEYSALVAANALDLESALLLVKKRGLFIREASRQYPGTMAAIIGLDAEQVKNICKISSKYGIIQVANYNCPGQIVISGEHKAVDKAIEEAISTGARKTIKLAVSGPFHSSLMQSAKKKLYDELQNYNIKTANLPIYANISAKSITQPSDIKEALTKQITGSVLWEESIENMISAGIRTFIEVGPKRVLSGLISRIDKNVQVLNVNDEQSLKKFVGGICRGIAGKK
ncbi:ACP S-malonyltransferase [bacterium]|nr:ACP S-malonyltransferase [bacterium]